MDFVGPQLAPSYFITNIKLVSSYGKISRLVYISSFEFQLLALFDHNQIQLNVSDPFAPYIAILGQQGFHYNPN